jgi:mRNA interferase MazF
LSNDIFNEKMGIVIATALTSKQPKFGFPLALEIDSADLPKKSWALTGQVRTLSIERIGKKIGRVSIEEIEQIMEGLNEIIGT